jgi:hypothetical protein
LAGRWPVKYKDKKRVSDFAFSTGSSRDQALTAAGKLPMYSSTAKAQTVNTEGSPPIQLLALL